MPPLNIPFETSPKFRGFFGTHSDQRLISQELQNLGISPLAAPLAPADRIRTRLIAEVWIFCAKARYVRHADRCLVQRHVQSDIVHHCRSPSLQGHVSVARCVPGELIPCAFVWHDSRNYPMLQKSKVAERRILRENPKRGAIADSYSLSRIGSRL